MVRKSGTCMVVGVAVVFALMVLFAAGCDEQMADSLDKKVEDKIEEKVVQQPQVEGPVTVKLETSKGDIIIELNENEAPVTVENFLRYANEGFFNGTIFHRVMSGFMIQGGGFTPDMAKKQPHEPIVNEAGNGLKNDRGTIAMARQDHRRVPPPTITSQFFINLKNNDFLNLGDPKAVGDKEGYAVFGKVVEGMEVVDAIAGVKTTRKGQHGNVPVEAVIIKNVKVISAR